MSQFDLYWLRHIQKIVQRDLTRKQNDFQSIKNNPDAPSYKRDFREIKKTKETERAVNQAVQEYYSEIERAR